jgi:hypothetical protein
VRSNTLNTVHVTPAHLAEPRIEPLNAKKP